MDEVIAELSKIRKDGGGYLTVRQLMKATGVPYSTIGKILQRLHDEGRLDVRFVKRTNILGRQQSVPAYKLKSPSQPDSPEDATRDE